MGWLILCVSGAWICDQALFWMFLEGVFSWNLYLNQWPSSKAFHNVGGPHFISWRHEQHKRLTSSKKEMCHQAASGPELKHWLFPESPACWPTLQILNLPISMTAWASSLKYPPTTVNILYRGTYYMYFVSPYPHFFLSLTLQLSVGSISLENLD